MMFSKFARVVAPQMSRWATTPVRPVRWCSQAVLKRPSAMDTVRHWDDWRMFWICVIPATLFGIFSTIQVFEFFQRQSHFDKLRDEEKNFEIMKKAGVFMSVRPDGTYRQYYNRTETYTSEPFLEKRDEDGQLEYKEDLGIFMQQQQKMFERNLTGEQRRSQVFDAELLQLAVQAIMCNKAGELSAILDDYLAIKDEVVSQNEDIEEGESIIAEEYSGSNASAASAMASFASEIKELQAAKVEEMEIEQIEEFDAVKVYELIGASKSLKAAYAAFVQQKEDAPENVKALLGDMFDK